MLHGEEKYKIRVPFFGGRVLYRLAPHTYIRLLTFSKIPVVKKSLWEKFDIPPNYGIIDSVAVYDTLYIRVKKK